MLGFVKKKKKGRSLASHPSHQSKVILVGGKKKKKEKKTTVVQDSGSLAQHLYLMDLIEKRNRESICRERENEKLPSEEWKYCASKRAHLLNASSGDMKGSFSQNFCALLPSTLR